MTLVRGSRAVVILVSGGDVVILVPVTVMINPFHELVLHERSRRMSAPSHLVLEVTLGASALTSKTRLRWPQGDYVPALMRVADRDLRCEHDPGTRGHRSAARAHGAGRGSGYCGRGANAGRLSLALVLSLGCLCADLPRAPGGKRGEHSLALSDESYGTAIRAVGITLRGSMVA